MPIVRNTQIIDGEAIEINIEIDDVPDAFDPYADQDLRDASQVLAKTSDLFGKGLELARTCAGVVFNTIQEMDAAIRPSEFEIQLAIKLNAETGAIITKLGAEAQMQVKMLWKHQQ
jgi:hypothetical protein